MLQGLYGYSSGLATNATEGQLQLLTLFSHKESKEWAAGILNHNGCSPSYLLPIYGNHRFIPFSSLRRSALGSIVDWKPAEAASLDLPQCSSPGPRFPLATQPMTEHGRVGDKATFVWCRASLTAVFSREIPISLTKTFSESAFQLETFSTQFFLSPLLSQMSHGIMVGSLSSLTSDLSSFILHRYFTPKSPACLSQLRVCFLKPMEWHTITPKCPLRHQPISNSYNFMNSFPFIYSPIQKYSL